MTNERAEVVFLVRMWKQRIEESGSGEWRGSIHQIDSGSHYYVAGAREVADYIAARLESEGTGLRRTTGEARPDESE
ncbi:MAG TPA: hypothetical protein VK760_05400 [Candidatus Acidoferrales bacterium]|nr:hypothetical protein [Candidatus Acidoferrales bacterium]